MKQLNKKFKIWKLKALKVNYNHKIIYKGTVDMCKKYHPLCFMFMVAKHEKEKEYTTRK